MDRAHGTIEAAAVDDVLPAAALRALQRDPQRCCLFDAAGVGMSNAAVLAEAWRLARELVRSAPADERCVGLALAPSPQAVVCALGVMLADRVPVFLNLAVAPPAIKYVLRTSDIRRVLTAREQRRMLAGRLSVPCLAVEDLAESAPAPGPELLERLPEEALRLNFPTLGKSSDSMATILFSSGSTGTPKGVVLTHRNLLANLTGVEPVIRLSRDDVVLGSLPFFHSFGFLTGLWLPLLWQRKVVFLANPTDALAVGEAVAANSVTVLFSTPTFLQLYLKRCDSSHFRSLRVIVTGAEKMQPEVAARFAQNFGVLPVEGYGCTELSPVVSVNLPESAREFGRACGRPGAVGRPLANIQVKIVDLEDGGNVPTGQEGLLLVRGPNVMKGYLGEPERTAEVLREGWYNTGDIARLDADGYLYITGRLARFTKIGGEMVPHGAVEAALHDAVRDHNVDLAVTSVPDAVRGERLVVLHTGISRPVRDVIRELRKQGLPNLWIPKAVDFCQVPSIPILASGKLDLRGCGRLAVTLALGKDAATPGAGAE